MAGRDHLDFFWMKGRTNLRSNTPQQGSRTLLSISRVLEVEIWDLNTLSYPLEPTRDDATATKGLWAFVCNMLAFGWSSTDIHRPQQISTVILDERLLLPLLIKQSQPHSYGCNQWEAIGPISLLLALISKPAAQKNRSNLRSSSRSSTACRILSISRVLVVLFSRFNTLSYPFEPTGDDTKATQGLSAFVGNILAFGWGCEVWRIAATNQPCHCRRKTASAFFHKKKATHITGETNGKQLGPSYCF